MKLKKLVIFLVLVISFFLIGCRERQENIQWTFEALDEIEDSFWTSKIMNTTDLRDGPEEWVLMFGRLITLFGEPLEMTEDLENAYTYVILATHVDGEAHVLTVYHGPSGPAIGGHHQEGVILAAEALRDYILLAEPSDFEWVGYYLDAPSRVYLQIENGNATYSEQRLTEEEARLVWERWFPE